MLAVQDGVETADEVAMAEEAVAEVPVQPCLGRHQRLVLQGFGGAHFYHRLRKQGQG